jgi:hypothetical protein
MITPWRAECPLSVVICEEMRRVWPTSIKKKTTWLPRFTSVNPPVAMNKPFSFELLNPRPVEGAHCGMSPYCLLTSLTKKCGGFQRTAGCRLLTASVQTDLSQELKVF